MQEIYDRWLYKAIITLAEDELRLLFSDTTSDEWPMSEEWEDMGNTSRHSLIDLALKRLGIPREDFQAWVAQSKAENLDDIFGMFGQPSGPIYPDAASSDG